MQILDVQVYEDWKSKNKTGMGAGVFSYVEKWANLMEKEMSNGAKLEDIADRLSHEADTEGITGFMYGCAVSVLAQCWKYGEQLKKWHNKDYDYDGDVVVNPALLTVKLEKEQ